MAPRSEKSQKKKKSNDKPKTGKASKKIFKPNKREQNNAATTAAKSEALALQLEDEVPDFPRGCRSSLSSYINFLESTFFFLLI